ncbi:Thiol:disulfide interchange protein DsbD [Emticicia aquatica]|jgi:thioredoxin-related protein|uniref:Thiol:disulfide interchange protein DsbD n=1 Tax=Emticicia aquatica TaxID=1681835 RepID=A0ABN8EYE7_9BACT|nr:thioredoxin family protein [Emticicia aquatica]CAH0996843.1 Thiol:disulfide interchange protein DsbD [Emticicia aquatica]
MKKTIFLAIVGLFFSVTTFAQHGAATGIKFTESSSWKEILKKAKAEKKLIFMDAYTTWCGPCKMLQARVFPNKQLGDFFNQNFVNAAIDMESEEGMRLSSIYEVQGYPSLFFIDPNTGKVIKMLLGYQEIEQLLDTGKKVVAKRKA